MRKIYILDTSVLIDDPGAYKHFTNSDIIIPIIVVNELDKKKLSVGEAGKNARVCCRLLDQISNIGDISTGVLLDDNIILKVDATYYDLNKFKGFGDPSYADTHILVSAYNAHRVYVNDEVTLVSNDVNLRIKAKARGINAISHEASKCSLSNLYTGCQVIVNENTGLDLQKKGFIDPELYGIELNANECVSFKDSSGEEIALARKVEPNKLKLIKTVYPWNLASRNKEQSFAIDLIMDKSIDLVTLTGAAGTGKTIIALSAALELVVNRKEYDKLIIYKPIQPVGNDIGYLPGPQPLSSKLLTPNGWTTMGEIKLGDEVISRDGKFTKVIGIYPKGKKSVFEIKTNENTRVKCCEDHLWLTSSLNEQADNKSSIKTTKEIFNSLIKKGKLNHSLPRNEPVYFNSKKLPIPAYTFGVLLGDGCFEKHRLSFSSKDTEIVERINNELAPLKIETHKHNNSINYNISLLKEIDALGLTNKKSYEKFIPNDYIYKASVEERINLLNGLMDSDGWCNKNGAAYFTTTSKNMCDDLLNLVRSLGGKAVFTTRNRIGKSHIYMGREIKNNFISYEISINFSNGINPFYLKRKREVFNLKSKPQNIKIKSIAYVGQEDVQCIKVCNSEQLYITDDFLVTHNTLEEKLSPWMDSFMDTFALLLSNSNGKWKASFDMLVSKNKIEMQAMTYIRGRSIANSIIIIDESQNINKENIKTILTRAGENSKILLFGDLNQIDNPNLDVTNNGLIYVIEKFKKSELAGHITFTQGERSKLATLAAEIL